MAFFRIVAWIFLLIAIVALVSDVTRTINGSASAFTSSFAYWNSVAPQSLEASAAFVRRTLNPMLWDTLAIRILLLPIWLLFGGLGTAMALLGRRKRRVNIYAN